MVFKTYKYGYWKEEIRKLLRRRLLIRDKVRYHRKKADNFEQITLVEIEEELNKYLKRARNKV